MTAAERSKRREMRKQTGANIKLTGDRGADVSKSRQRAVGEKFHAKTPQNLSLKATAQYVTAVKKGNAASLKAVSDSHTKGRRNSKT